MAGGRRRHTPHNLPPLTHGLRASLNKHLLSSYLSSRRRSTRFRARTRTPATHTLYISSTFYLLPRSAYPLPFAAGTALPYPYCCSSTLRRRSHAAPPLTLHLAPHFRHTVYNVYCPHHLPDYWHPAARHRLPATATCAVLVHTTHLLRCYARYILAAHRGSHYMPSPLPAGRQAPISYLLVTSLFSRHTLHLALVPSYVADSPESSHCSQLKERQLIWFLAMTSPNTPPATLRYCVRRHPT